VLPLLYTLLITPPANNFQLDLVHAINQARVDNGLLPLKVDETLDSAAQGYADELADSGRFDHYGADGSSPASRATKAGYKGLVAENLAIGYSEATAVVEGWLKSEGHRRNLLNPNYRFLGVGEAEHRRGKVWVLDLGLSDVAYPVILELDAPQTPKTDIRVDISEPGLAKEMHVVLDGKAEPEWRRFESTFQLSLMGTGLHEVTVELRGSAGWKHTSRSQITKSL
jgi:hypothetical protein